MRFGPRAFVLLLPALVVVAAPISASAQVSHPFRGSDVVLTRDEIAASGAVRLSDVLRLIPGWYDYSVDGFTWSFVPDVLDLPRQDGWILLIDGQPVDLRVLGNLEINALGLDVGLIDSVEVFSRPVFKRGIVAPNGMVHIHTRPAKRYVELQGSLGVGNAVDDPGPFLFTPYESANIDRLGPTVSASAAASGRNWYVRGAMKHDEHHITDPRIWPRVWLLFQDHFQARQQLLAQRFDARGFFLNGEVGFSIDNFRLHQFRFDDQFGAEIPVSLVYSRFGSAADVEVQPGVRFSYSGRHSVIQLDPRENSENIHFDYREESVFASADLTMELPSVTVEVGASHELRNIETDDPVIDPRASNSGGYAALTVEPLPGLSGSAMLDIRRFDGELVQNTIGGLDYTRAIGSVRLSSRLRAASFRTPTWPGGDLWFWTQRGYGFLDRIGAQVSTPRNPFPSPVRQWAELSMGASWSRYARLTVSGAYSRLTQRTVAVYDRQLAYRDVGLFEREATLFETQVHLETPVAGEVLRGSIETIVTPFPILTYRAHYSYTLPVSPNARFRDLWAVVPDHQLMMSLTYTPRDRLSVDVRLRHESWSTWPEYAAVDAASGGVYPSRLPAHVLLDVAVRKQFWKHRLEGSALLTNLLNRHVQRHPAARVEQLTLWARAEVRI